MTTDQNTTLPSPSATPPTSAAPPKWNVLAIVGFIASFLFALVGIVCSAIGLRQISRTGDRGRGLAIAGIIIGAVNLVASILTGVLLAIGATAVATHPSHISLHVGPSAVASADCARLEEIATRASGELRTAASASTPEAANGVAGKITAMAHEFQAVADDADDQDVADAADSAATALTDLGDAMTKAVASGDTSGLTDKASTVVSSMTAVGQACH